MRPLTLVLLAVLVGCSDKDVQPIEPQFSKCPPGRQKQGKCVPEPPPVVVMDSLHIVDFAGERLREVTLTYLGASVQFCALAYYSDGTRVNSCGTSEASYQLRVAIAREAALNQAWARWGG